MNTVTRIHYSECIDKKAINPGLCPAYSLTEIQGYFIKNMFGCLLDFCRLRRRLICFGFCGCFSRIHLQVRGDFYDTRGEECLQTEDNCIHVS